MLKSLAFATLLSTCALALGCGTQKGHGATDAGTGAHDAGPNVDTGLDVPAASCAHPGDVGNAMGVGRFCTPMGSECPMDGAYLCIVTFEPSTDQWFCTIPLCTTDTECGPGAMCAHDPRGSACVLVGCNFGADAGM